MLPLSVGCKGQNNTMFLYLMKNMRELNVVAGLSTLDKTCMDTVRKNYRDGNRAHENCT